VEVKAVINAAHFLRWAILVVFAVYLPVQVLALRRLKGELKSRGARVLIVISVLTLLQSWIRGAFENREASEIATAVVCIAALVATWVLIQMLRRERNSGGELNSGLSRKLTAESLVLSGSNSVVESQPSKLLVAGSIPVSRSRILET
jgi:hypothetical protein